MRRLWLGVELLTVFGAVPAAYAVWGLGAIPPLPLLCGAALLAFASLRRDATFDRAELSRAAARHHRAGPWLRRFALGAVAVAAVVAVVLPEQFLDLPRQRPGLWALIMVFYPLVSVVPQELIWRTFFHHRYRPLFRSRAALVAGSAIAFGFMHIVFYSWVAVALTAAGGALFALTYERTRSLWHVCGEHALYGCLMFTIGLGNFFYNGAAAQRAAEAAKSTSSVHSPARRLSVNKPKWSGEHGSPNDGPTMRSGRAPGSGSSSAAASPGEQSRSRAPHTPHTGAATDGSRSR